MIKIDVGIEKSQKQIQVCNNELFSISGFLFQWEMDVSIKNDVKAGFSFEGYK